MKKMQELQPKMAALKSKFKGDNQGLQQATMAIYKEHKVNPMAGCLPMVVQIPVFFALYKVLYNAIELRGAGFLYIPDLSLKDPYYITPILMGVTMLIQQRMTPTVGDPMQAKMMMFMPVIMTAMFINFSSGLVLYFLFSNIMSIGEQKLFRVIAARGQAKAAPEDDPGAGGGKKKRLPRESADADKGASASCCLSELFRSAILRPGKAGPEFARRRAVCTPHKRNERPTPPGRKSAS